MQPGQIFLVVISLLVLSGLGWNSYCDYYSVKQLSLAKETLSKGYPRIAFEVSKKLRKKVKLTEEECDLLLAIDSRMQNAENLFLNAEKCLYSGGENRVAPYLAISQAFEINKDVKNAKAILLKSVQQVNFDKSFFFRLSSLSYIEGNKDEAFKILTSLIARNKNDEKVLLASIQFFTQRNEWKIANNIVPMLEGGVKNLSFESQITLYGVAKKNEDSVRVEKYIAQVNEVLSKLPKEQADKIRSRIQQI